MHYKRKKLFWKVAILNTIYLFTANQRPMTSLVGNIYVNNGLASNTSVLGSGNVSGVHCIAHGCTNYFYKDQNVSFYRFPKDKQQLCRWLQSRHLTPLASTPEQSRAARRVHTASIPWQSRCCRCHQHPLIDIITYSASRFPATMTNTEQMPKTVLIPAVVLVA